MESLNQVTPLILTYNEEANIGRTLAGLSWARRIVVIDSGSKDSTLYILNQHKNVDVYHRDFDSHGQQWNYGLAQIHHGWVLSLDADYLVSPVLRDEMFELLAESARVSGYEIPFRYCVFGKPLRGTVLPPRVALFRREAAYYVDDGHTQDLVLSGICHRLHHPLLHDDRKPLKRWLWAQQRYLALEVIKLRCTPPHQLSLADRLRRHHVVAPIAVLFLCLIWHRGILDGWRGWFYAFQRTYVEILLSLMLWEAAWSDQS